MKEVCLSSQNSGLRHMITVTVTALVVVSLLCMPGYADISKKGVWISAAELADLPVAGEAWRRLKQQALVPAGSPNLSNQNHSHNVFVLAKALVSARCRLTPTPAPCQEINFLRLRDEVIQQVLAALETENGGRTLALARNLAAYVIAADLVGLPSDTDQIFRNWLKQVRHERLGGTDLISTHEKRPNNWGTHAGASRAAIAVYLGDTADLERTAQVLQGWLGNRSAYAGFKYRDLAWQCDPSKPVGINPKGCSKRGHSIDGVLPDDQRRSGPFQWPPPKENYVYGGLAGVIVQAVILHRAGYDAFNWSDRAILRAYEWLYKEAKFPAVGDDTWQLPLIDCFYGTNFWNGTQTLYGKNMGWTEWTHAEKGGCRRRQRK